MARNIAVFLTLCVLLMSVAPVCAVPADSPAKPEVVKQHRELLEKYGIKPTSGRKPGTGNRKNERSSDKRRDSSFSDFGKWLNNLALPLIVIIIVSLVVLFYFFFRGSSGLLQGRVKMADFPDPGTGEQDIVGRQDPYGDGAYTKALELAKNRQYGSALVTLHKSSLRKLQRIHLVQPGDNFTNNQVRRMLKQVEGGSVLLTPFGQLASAAERIAFKGEESSKNTFETLKVVYENAFLKLGRGG